MNRPADPEQERATRERIAANQFDGLGLFAPATNSARSDTSLTHAVPVRAHLRRVKGEPRPSAGERRDAGIAKATSQEPTKVACEYVRAKLVELYHSRERDWRRAKHWDLTVDAPFVTADDADLILRAWPQCPREIWSLPSQAWRGSIFRGKGWRKTGQRVLAGRGHMHSTDLPCWAVAEAA